MMSSISTPRITAVVEIYENERAWIGGGFSKRGLLPTDRRPYSTRDGSLSWKTLGEAGTALLGRGWVYDDDDDDDEGDEGGEGESGFTPVTKDEGEDCTDEEGWRYATDFGSGSLKSASRKRGMTHFVRRRRLCRRKRFDPDHYLPREVYVKCEHCDSEAVDALSSKLLESLSAAAALHRGAGARMTDAVVLPLKAKLIDGLDIGIPVRRRAGDDASARLATIIGGLDRFGERQQTALSRTCSILQHAHHDGDAGGLKSPSSSSAGTADRAGSEVLERYLGKEERDAIAGLVVRDIDPGYELHCDRELCGEGCRFQVVGCPNAGCDREISRTHLERHVGECGFGVVPCPNGCGDSFPRNRREVHLADACSLRDAECPFKKIGCTAVVPARDAPGHIVDNADSHLLMAANRMMEYETLFRDLLSRVKRLEEENTHLKQRVGTSATDLAAANSAIHSMKKKNLSMTRDLSHANSQVSTLSKKLAGLETSCRSEFKQINKRLK